MIDMPDNVREWIECDKLVDGGRIKFDVPKPGNKIEVALVSTDAHPEKFVLSLYEGARSSTLLLTIDGPRKHTMQTRRSTLPLVRVDIDEGARHTNPDGTLLCGSHVHVATDGFGQSIAFPLGSPEGMMVAGSSNHIPDVFEAFRKYCHIDDNLNIRWSLGI